LLISVTPHNQAKFFFLWQILQTNKLLKNQRPSA
jgi:hypothetical protein